MRRWGVAAGVAVLLIGALLFMRPFATRDRDVIASTPAAAGVFTPLQSIDLKPNDQLCITSVPVDEDSKFARVFVYTFGKPGAPLRVDTYGKGFHSTTRLPSGYPEGQVELPLRPPAKASDGQICMRNVGTTKVGIQATQVGQRFSRPRPWLNGFPLEQDVPMTLHTGEPQSLIQQTPRAIQNAAVFVPLGSWAIWILLVLVLVGIPAGVFFALARADAAPVPASGGAGIGASPAVPFPRARGAVRRGTVATIAAARRVPAWAWLTLIVVVGIGFAYLWASRMGTFQNDEAQNVYFGRWMANNLPDGLWNFSLLDRGLQRAEIFVLAATLGTLKTPTAFLVTHFINVTAWSSAAIPAYLLVRGLGTRAVWALLAALLTIVGPWLVFSVSFLTEPLAYPAAVWLVWAIWRAVVDPRVATELTVVVVLFLALLTRSAFLILVPLWPAVVFLHELRFGHLRGRPKAVVSATWARHKVLVVLVVGGAAVLLLNLAGLMPGPKRLTGAYGTPFNVIWEPFLKKTALYASRVVVGTGFIPFAVGLPWLIAQLIRPDDERTHAFVVTAALMIVLIVYASSPAGPDERYVIYFGPPLIIGAIVAIARGRLAWPWVAAGGVLGAILIYKHGWNPEGGAYGFFIGPGETFFARVGLLHLQDYVPQGISLYKGALIVALGATAVLTYAFMRRSASRVVLLTLVAGLALLQVAQASYTTSKFVTQGGERFGASHKERAWVDEAIYGKGTAGIAALGLGNTVASDPAWAEIQFWNTSVISEFGIITLQVQLPPGDYGTLMKYDPETGRVTSSTPIPPYAVVPRSYVDVGLAGKPVAHATYLAADLVKLAQPLRIDWASSGPHPDGFLDPNAKATIRFFAGDRPPQCGIVPLTGPGEGNGSIQYRLGSLRGRVPYGKTVDVHVPLDFKGKSTTDVVLVSPSQVKLPDNRVEAVQVGQIRTGAC